MNLKKFINKLDFEWNTMSMTMHGEYSFDCDFNISPDEFINYAKKDIVLADKHGLVNAMSNAKRAIECQADTVLDSLTGVELNRRNGLDTLPRFDVRRGNLPHKLKLLREMGVASPIIVEKVNRQRNLLEHEYELSERSKVEEAIDIAELFVAACSKSLRAFPEEMYIRTEEQSKQRGQDDLPDYLYIFFNLGQKYFLVNTDGSLTEEVIVTPRDWQEFCALMRLAISAHPYRTQRESVQEFITSVRNITGIIEG